MSTQSAESYLDNANSLVREGQFQSAIECYRQAIQLNPKLVQAYANLYQVYQHLGQAEESLACLIKAVELEPALLDVEGHINIARLLTGQGRHAEAIRSCGRALAVNAALPDLHIFIGEIHCKMGRIDQATRSYKRALSLNPTLGEVNNKQHVCLGFLSRLERLARAHADLVDAIKECADYLSTYPDEAQEYFYQGAANVTSGDLGLAIENYRNALRLNPSFAEAHYCLGNVLSTFAGISGESARYNEAIASFEEAVRLRPSWARAHYRLGTAKRALYWSGPNNYDEVLVNQREAIKLDPHLTEALAEAFDILQRQGKWNEAFPLMKQYSAAKKERFSKNPLSKLKVRFVKDCSYAIGHMAFLPEVYVKMEELGWIERFDKVMLAPPAMIANQSLLDYWRKYFYVITDPEIIEKLYPIASILEHDSGYITLPDGRVMNAPAALSVVQKEWDEQKRPPILALNDADRERGWDCLARLGVPRGSWFVALHVREAGFKSEGSGPHNLHRNSDIATYQAAIDGIIEQGGWVVRLGESNMKRLPPRHGLVEYSHSEFKSDWMDIFLCSQSRVFLGSSGGVISVPQLFGVPLIATNFPPATIQHGVRDLFIPKLVWNKEKKRLLTFREMWSEPLIHNQEGRHFLEWGLEFVDNTPEELREVTQEMLDRASGRAHYTAEDEELQARFQGLISSDFGIFTYRMGRDFLRKYASLLPGPDELSSGA